MKITIQSRRQEALAAGYEALRGRIALGFEDFCAQLAAWDVSAFCDGERVVGMLMVRGPELHVAVLPEVRGRWLSRRLIREVFAPILERFGKAQTKVAPDNAIGRDFVQRIRAGFAALEFDPTTALAVAGTQLVGGMIQGDAAQSAASQQAGAANQATQATLGMFNTQNSQQAPYRQAGYNALTSLGQYTGTDTRGSGTPDTTYGTLMHQFGPQDLATNLAPNYQFALGQGLGATTNLLNASGGALSGNTLKGLTDYATNFAQNAYQNAFANYTANQTNIFNRLSAIAGLGQTANAQSTAAFGTAAPAISQATQAAGTARAGGTVGAANALVGGANNALGWYTLSNFMNPGGGGSPVSEMVPGQFSLGNPAYG